MSPAVSARGLGDVIPYWYLWWREHERGEDAGRKWRPCVVIAVASGETSPLLAVLPITHASPNEDRAAIEIPPRIKNHLGLDAQRSWVICDEQNEFHWPGFDLERTPSGASSFGAVPDAFLQKVRDLHHQVRRRGGLKSTPRD